MKGLFKNLNALVGQRISIQIVLSESLLPLTTPKGCLACIRIITSYRIEPSVSIAQMKILNGFDKFLQISSGSGLGRPPFKVSRAGDWN